MIENTILSYLKAHNINAHLVMPDDETNFVLIERTGGTSTYSIKTSTFAIQSYGKTLKKACELNETVKETLFNMIELDTINKVSLNSDYNFTDKTTKKYRYQAVFQVVHY